LLTTQTVEASRPGRSRTVYLMSLEVSLRLIGRHGVVLPLSKYRGWRRRATAFNSRVRSSRLGVRCRSSRCSAMAGRSQLVVPAVGRRRRGGRQRPASSGGMSAYGISKVFPGRDLGRRDRQDRRARVRSGGRPPSSGLARETGRTRRIASTLGIGQISTRIRAILRPHIILMIKPTACRHPRT